MKNILVVDDSKFMRMTIKDTLVEAGYNVVGEAENGETAFKLALILKPDIITLDNVLPDMFGLDVMDLFNEEGLKFKVVMVSAVGQDIAQAEAKDVGIDDYLVKPFTKEDLLQKVGRLAAQLDG
jgi:two-component system chemotaxis response regulator CheY